MEAMSWELPVVTRIPLLILNLSKTLVTGFLITAPKTVPYYYQDTLHPNFGSPASKKRSTPDKDVVLDLVRQVGSPH